MMIRTALKTATAWAANRSGLNEVVRARRFRDLPFVVGYHRVVERMAPAGLALPSMEVTVPTLERHLDWLGRHFRIISLDDYADHVNRPRAGKPLAAITFDDGYADFYHHAFPMLRRKGIPAAIFVVTNIIGSDRAPIHEELYAALQRSGRRDAFAMTQATLQRLPQVEVRRRIDLVLRRKFHAEALRPLDWNMIREMRAAGMTIGSHSKTHAFLANETAEQVRDELEGSRDALVLHLGSKPEWFAYPGGSFHDDVIAAVARAGYRFAFTDCRYRSARYPLLTLPRKGLWERSCADASGRFSDDILSCHAAAIFDSFSHCTHGH